MEWPSESGGKVDTTFCCLVQSPPHSHPPLSSRSRRVCRPIIIAGLQVHISDIFGAYLTLPNCATLGQGTVPGKSATVILEAKCHLALGDEACARLPLMAIYDRDFFLCSNYNFLKRFLSLPDREGSRVFSPAHPDDGRPRSSQGSEHLFPGH